MNMKLDTPLKQEHKYNLQKAGTMAAKAMRHNDIPCAREWIRYADRLIRHCGEDSRSVYMDAYRKEANQ